MEEIRLRWEEENFHIPCVEFCFDGSEPFAEIGPDVWDNETYGYQVMRLPIGRVDIMQKAEDHGFRFVETNFDLAAKLKNLELPKELRGYIERMDYVPADQNATDRTLQTIARGVFATDKVALDPKLSKEISAKRFHDFCSYDLKEGSAKCYEVRSEGEAIGFFVLKEVGKSSADSWLAGLYDPDENTGLGFATIYFAMEEAKRLGKKSIITGVSSNNMASLRVHTELGYRIKTANYVLVKHVKGITK